MKEKKQVYYVTMTDKFVSGWGKAGGKIKKLVFKCDSWEEAEIVEDNARNRSDQKNINNTTRKPYYPSDRYYVQYKTKADYPNWYVRGYFQARKGG